VVLFLGQLDAAAAAAAGLSPAPHERHVLSSWPAPQEVEAVRKQLAAQEAAAQNLRHEAHEARRALEQEESAAQALRHECDGLRQALADKDSSISRLAAEADSARAAL
jgi:predicted RNase H-like nuclease (RuvC/YqgF family)